MGAGDEPRFLRSNVIIEPLADRFYAWLDAVAPIQAAMTLAHGQMPLLESYLRSPRSHLAVGTAAALSDRVDVDEARATEVACLVDSIKRDRSDMLDVAAAVVEAEELMRQDATGFDLAGLYAKLPQALNGLVEIVYGNDRHPSIRYLEPLAYRSAAYDERRQSVRLSLDDGARRPCILSTPRLPSRDALDLPLPLRHPGLDALAEAGIRPTTAARLREALELDEARVAKLEEMLSPRPTLAADRHIDRGGRIRYFGHACLVVQTPVATVVTDPFISTDNRARDRYTLDDLPDHIDLVVITNGDPDHLVAESLLRLRGRVDRVVVPRTSRGTLGDPSLGLYVSHLGLPVVEVDDFDEVSFPGGTVVATPFVGDLDVRGRSAYCIQLPDASLFVGGDSAGINPPIYRRIRDHVGKVDIAFLGMACGSPSWTGVRRGPTAHPTDEDDRRPLPGSDAAQAIAIMSELGADEAYVYAMGEESWQRHIVAAPHRENAERTRQIDKFLRWCADRGITAERLINKREWRW